MICWSAGMYVCIYVFMLDLYEEIFECVEGAYEVGGVHVCMYVCIVSAWRGPTRLAVLSGLPEDVRARDLLECWYVGMYVCMYVCMYDT